MRQRIYAREYPHTATQAVVTNQNVTAPQGRGPIIGIDFLTENSDLGNQGDVKVTVAVNGDEVMKDVSLLYFGSNYQKVETMHPVDAPEGSSISVSYDNDTAATDVEVRLRVITDYSRRARG